MKKINLILLFILLLNSMLYSQLYFNLGIEEGAFFTSGNIYFINDISSDLAYMIPFNEKNALITYYQLKYAGPGIGNSTDAKLSERSQDHYFMLKYIMKLNAQISIKPCISFLKEFYKFSKSEEWGEGLYDFNKYEIGVDINYSGINKLPVNFKYKYQIFKYPNYTDLLTMYLTSLHEEKEIENYKNHFIAISFNQSTIFTPLLLSIEYDLNLSNHDNKKILDITGYTGTENQNAFNHLINIFPQYRLNDIVFGLNFLYELNTSNQNYIFGFPPETTQFYKNYYSYKTLTLKPSVTYSFSDDKYISLMFSYLNKKYDKRPAQNDEGIFSDSKLNVKTSSVGVTYYTKISKYFSLNPLYMYIKSSSNNKYQQSVSYNYDAHLISLQLNYEY